MASRYLIVAPVIAAVTWILLLLYLFTLWIGDGTPKYKITAADIAYISHIGAQYHALFILGACITSFFFLLTLLQFIVLHILRSRAPTTTTTTLIPKPHVWSDIVAFIFGIIATGALILLSIYDAIDYEDFHWGMTLTFAFSAIICAIFNLIGMSTFRQQKRQHKLSFVLKILFIILSTVVLVTMIYLMYSCEAVNNVLSSQCNTVKSIAAVLEWTLGLLFFIFIFTWILDFSS